MSTSNVSHLVCLLLFPVFQLFSQPGVTISNTPVPDEPGAVLNVHSSNQGVLLPRTQADSVLFPVHGMLVFDTIENTFMLYDSDHWVALLKASDFSFFHADRDGDTWGNPLSAIFAPSAPPGYVTGLYCDDKNATVAPGMQELCDDMTAKPTNEMPRVVISSFHVESQRATGASSIKYGFKNLSKQD